MSVAVIRSIPVESSLVPSFLEDIIDRKIANLSLNILEELVDWILSWIYFPYHQLYQEKSARVHTFSDGLTRLVDSTKLGVANIEYDWSTDFVSLHAIKVYFIANPNIDFTFSRQTNTDYVVVIDDEKRGPGWYKIVEQEIARPMNPRPMEKCWYINTRNLHKAAGGYPKNFFLVEQPIPINPALARV